MSSFSLLGPLPPSSVALSSPCSPSQSSTSSSGSRPTSLSVSSASIMALGPSTPHYSMSPSLLSRDYIKSAILSDLYSKPPSSLPSDDSIDSCLIRCINIGVDLINYRSRPDIDELVELVAERIDEIKQWSDASKNYLMYDLILMNLIEINPVIAPKVILAYLKMTRLLPGFFFNSKYNDLLMQIAPHVNILKMNLSLAKADYGNYSDFSPYTINTLIEKFSNVLILTIIAIATENEEGSISIRCPKLEDLYLSFGDRLKSFSVDSPAIRKVTCNNCSFEQLEKFSINSYGYQKLNSQSKAQLIWSQSITLPRIEIFLYAFNEFCAYHLSSISSSSSSSITSGPSTSSSSTSGPGISSLSTSSPSTSGPGISSLTSSSPSTSLSSSGLSTCSSSISSPV